MTVSRPGLNHTRLDTGLRENNATSRPQGLASTGRAVAAAPRIRHRPLLRRTNCAPTWRASIAARWTVCHGPSPHSTSMPSSRRRPRSATPRMPCCATAFQLTRCSPCGSEVSWRLDCGAVAEASASAGALSAFGGLLDKARRHDDCGLRRGTSYAGSAPNRRAKGQPRPDRRFRTSR